MAEVKRQPQYFSFAKEEMMGKAYSATVKSSSSSLAGRAYSATLNGAKVMSGALRTNSK
jgi:hypothetical protein